MTVDNRRPRVLVVDDEEGIQQTLREVLDIEGYEVVVASNGRQALDIISRWLPDVIVLDLMMPVMSGRAFREAQLALPDGGDGVPVVVISGARDARGRAEAIGAAAVIVKPFDLDDVVTTVERVIDDHST